MQLILDTTGRTFKRDMGPKWDTTNYTAEVCVRETGMLRGATALRLPQDLVDCWSQNGTDVLKWDIPRTSYFLSFAVILSSMCN